MLPCYIKCIHCTADICIICKATVLKRKDQTIGNTSSQVEDLLKMMNPCKDRIGVIIHIVPKCKDMSHLQHHEESNKSLIKYIQVR